MKFVSWNVNGLRACLKKGFMESFRQLDADIFCLQETKMQPGQAILELPGYQQYWNSAEKKGYSGTAVFTRQKPLAAWNGIGLEEHDHEGRVITLEFSGFYFITVYVPNSKRGLERLAYRMAWEDAFRAYVKGLDEKKPVIFAGDLNVAHEEIDLKNPKTNHKNAGFTDEERAKFTALLETGFIDTFRARYPERTGAYSWWSYLRKARLTNAGWRIDYFVISERLRGRIDEAAIYNEIYGSDHCPIGLTLQEGSLKA
jgi:exodeoxyribonuclease-3